jgi:hypothetical protein
MAEIEPIDIQVTKLVGKLSAITEREIPAAQARALNRTLDSGVTQLSRILGQQLKLPVRKVKRRLFKDRARPSRLRAKVRVYNRGVAAIDLPGVRDKGRYKKGKRGRVGSGVSARGGHSWGDAFIAKGRGGKKHVFWQVTAKRTHRKNSAGHRVANTYTKGKRIGQRRAALDVIHIAIKQDVEQIAPRVLQNEMRTHYGQRLKRELQYRIDKYKA